MKVIGIDIGTTTISGVVLDREADTVLAARTVENGSFMETGRSWERLQDVAVIVRKATLLLEELLEQHPDAAAIGLTGQMHGILYTDDAGRCISPLYTWQDGRGGLPTENTGADGRAGAPENIRADCGTSAEEDAGADGRAGVPENTWADCETGAVEKTGAGAPEVPRLAQRETLAEEVFRETGIEIAAGYGLLTHLYNQRHGEVPDGAARLCTIADYFAMVLTGRRYPLMHVSNAASLGFFDCGRLCFARRALRRFGIDEKLLPEVTADFAVTGYYKGIPVCAALGDNQAGFLGSVGFRKNVLLVNMGTGGQISMMTDRYIKIPDIETRPLDSGRYLLVGASLCGGRAYAILEAFFRMYAGALTGEEAPQYETMERLARSGGTGTLEVSTLFAGTRTQPGLRGSITNICEDNFTPAELIRGVMKGMAAELYEMYRKIEESTGSRAELLVASGNGLRKNALLRETFSEMFRAEICLARFEEEAACGAALSAADA
ncbi:carbohydrate kinase, FGGY family protein [Marvinbryantia formatexigens DSM 14469]|uniref:Carbohydrate kinase, FGGY family protein n=1 Tax=Marvinbryantia formatexigens DSM 14469 TaxID=478749 RepID=C6LBY3_9FIRM|nr:FGGY family carbohydrate kinase [Marvinbryantia formatexigens]EET61936.1 carbohydrate kinase, FGGY family protein [Marvinbryantia formatexigens DSM 14469]UWO25725.1 FGGY family carbohydrate kinase [Marvinbryantia formatexigens DSM 14469]SDF34449.1 sedoheptulokinase [Marvinbryantia formatexigens]